MGLLDCLVFAHTQGERKKMKNSFKKGVATAGLVAAAGFAGMLTLAPAASADGTSGSVNGTYARWWNTAFAGYGSNVNVAGRYQLRADRSSQTDYTGSFKHLSVGFTGKFDNSDSTFGVSSAWTVYGG